MSTEEMKNEIDQLIGLPTDELEAKLEQLKLGCSGCGYGPVLKSPECSNFCYTYELIMIGYDELKKRHN